MIRTRFDDSKDLKLAVAPGLKAGIIACSDCAAVFHTSDTRRVRQVCEALEGRNEILFRLSVSSPCDGRVFARMAATAPRFLDADCYIVLACEAGLRVISSYIRGSRGAGGGEFRIVSPVVTMGYAMVDPEGRPHASCIFCPECGFAGGEGPCPVAGCPAHKPEGPCQDRQGDICPYGAERRKCSWL